MPIPAVKIELHIQGCQQLVSDILSQFVIWANRIHVLENKLVLDVKEVQCKKSFARFEPWGEYASALQNLKLSSSDFFQCQRIIIIFHNLYQNEQFMTKMLWWVISPWYLQMP